MYSSPEYDDPARFWRGSRASISNASSVLINCFGVIVTAFTEPNLPSLRDGPNTEPGKPLPSTREPIRGVLH